MPRGHTAGLLFRQIRSCNVHSIVMTIGPKYRRSDWTAGSETSRTHLMSTAACRFGNASPDRSPAFFGTISLLIIATYSLLLQIPACIRSRIHAHLLASAALLARGIESCLVCSQLRAGQCFDPWTRLRSGKTGAQLYPSGIKVMLVSVN